MIVADIFKGQKVAILGLARSGLSAAKSLIAGGAEIVAWDDDEKNREAARAENIPLADLTAIDWTGIRAMVLSPGIPHTLPAPHAAVTRAKSAGVKIISDIYLLMQTRRAATYVGITGTNGKSTTTSMIAHIIQSAQKPMEAGGNLGRAALTLEPLGADGYYVLELSSYQLELIPDCRINVAVFLNLTPDHLDRHGDMDGYLAAKRNIFNNQQKSDAAIIGVDDEWGEKLFAELSAAQKQKTVAISTSKKLDRGIYVLDNWLYDGTISRHEKIMDLSALTRLPGIHNWQNIAAGYAAAKYAGIDRDDIVRGITDFPGLAHRQQEITTIDGIRFINDSKATNAEAAAKALACYRPIYWILGGKPKTDDLDACVPLYGNVQQAFLIGQAADLFERLLSPHMPTKKCETIDRAVEDAFAQAKMDGMRGAVVLLSPACASFDQFRDFEHRGDTFRDIVLKISHAKSPVGDAA